MGRDGLFNGNFNPRTSFSSFLICPLTVILFGWCMVFVFVVVVCVDVCLFTWPCPEHIEYIGCTSKGSAQICFFVFVFVFMSLFWMLNDICDVCLNSRPFCVSVLFISLCLCPFTQTKPIPSYPSSSLRLCLSPLSLSLFVPALGCNVVVLASLVPRQSQTLFCCFCSFFLAKLTRMRREK